jgi:hypothetical protein
LSGLHNRWERVPKSNATIPLPKLDELIAINVPDSTAEAMANKARGKQWILVVPFGIGVATAGNQCVSSDSLFLGMLKVHIPRSPAW